MSAETKQTYSSRDYQQNLAESSEHPNTWSELPSKHSNLIFKRLNFIDTDQYKTVCHSWNMSALSFPMPGTLWLMFHSSPDSLVLSSLTQKDRLYKVNKNVLPDVFRSVQECNYHVESTQGWIVVLEKEPNPPHIFNPFSGDCIRVPPLHSTVTRLVLSSDPCLNKDYRIVAMHYNQEAMRLSLYKAGDDGDNTWTSTVPLEEYYVDIMSYNDKVFGLTQSKTLHTWDFSNAPTKFPIPTKVVHVDSKFQSHPIDIGKDDYLDTNNVYLVESLGEILAVQQILSRRYFSAYSSTIGFTVFKLGCAKTGWMPIETLQAGRAILAKRNGSECVSIQDFPELEENSIYLLDSDCFVFYNLKEKKVRIHEYGNCHYKRCCPVLVVCNHGDT